MEDKFIIPSVASDRTENKFNTGLYKCDY